MVLRTLGALELEEVAFARPKPLLLLAHLSLEGTRPRRHVAELLWPTARDPMKSLGVALARIRAGAPGAVESQAGRVRTTLESDAAALLAALDGGDVDGARRLYRGPFLAGVELPSCGAEFEEWVLDRSEGIADRLRFAMLERARSAADEGRFAAAGREAEEAFRLPGTSPLPPEELASLYTLLRAGGRSSAFEVGAEVAAFDLDIARTPAEARARLRPAVAHRAHPPLSGGGGTEVERGVAFVRSFDGARIAYARTGEGPPLVKAANWLGHLEHDRASPVWRHWLGALSSRNTLIRYDERGCGLSDRRAELSLEAFVRDLEVLVDALELDRFPLLGISQGAATALTYAVRHPDRVSHLVLYGGYFDPEPAHEAEALVAAIRVGWGRDNPAFRQLFTTLFMPDATPAQAASFNDLQYHSATPSEAAALARAIFDIDVRPLAERVRTPALVAHARNDAVVPFESSRRLAAQVPGARFVPLESDNHVLLEPEPAWPRFVSELERFLATEAAAPQETA